MVPLSASGIHYRAMMSPPHQASHASQDPGSSAPADEAALIASLRTGDEQAYAQLVREMGGRMFAVARKYFNQDDDAWDAVQDAFVSALKAIDRFDGRSRLSTWLHRIVINACLMKLRARRRRPEHQIDDLLPAFVDDGHAKHHASAWRLAGSSGIEGAEVRALVRRAIDELPDGYREVLLLRDIEGLDTAETAVALGLTDNAVKTRLHRARQALREILDPHFRDESGERR